MIWVHLLFAVAVAIAFTAILFAVGRGGAYEQGGWGAALVLFAILFLTSWAGGVWLNPVGPRLFGAEWMPFVLMGFVVALLVAAMSPARRPRNRVEAQVQAQEAAAADEVVSTTLTAFFWVFAVALIAAITLHYAYIDPRNQGHLAERPAAETLR